MTQLSSKSYDHLGYFRHQGGGRKEMHLFLMWHACCLRTQLTVPIDETGTSIAAASYGGCQHSQVFRSIVVSM